MFLVKKMYSLERCIKRCEYTHFVNNSKLFMLKLQFLVEKIYSSTK